jgi:DNA-binding NarL/FixJ family response regulator
MIMETKKIKVLLADDTLIAREGFKIILDTADDIEIVGESMSAHETPRKVLELEPDVLLMDLKWFGDDTAGWATIREIKRATPKVKVIAVTAYENLIREARAAGADDALTKTFTREELLDHIRDLALHQNDFRLPGLISSRVVDFTKREREVVKLLAVGKPDKEIAISLGIATTTAKNHVKKILAKLGAQNRTEASNLARELGLLDQE